jgi:hypothetical protein
VKSGHNPSKSGEAEALSNVLSHDQSTHRSAPEQSAAQSLKRLKKRYDKARREEAASEIRIILEKKVVSDLPDDQQKPYLYYLTKLSKSNIKKTFQLVCAAVLDADNDAFREPGYHAEDNKVFRIDSLFNAINALRIEGRCDTGNRNDLLSTLNYVHRDILIIDDYDLFLRSSAKDWLISKWEKGAHKKELFSRVVKYIKFIKNENNIELSDIDRDSLIEHWKLNLEACGLNWENAEKQALGIVNSFYFIDIPILPSYQNEMLALIQLDELHECVSLNNLPLYLNSYQEQIENAYQMSFKCIEFDELNDKGLTLFVRCLQFLQKIDPHVNRVGGDAEMKDILESKERIGKLVEHWSFSGQNNYSVINEELVKSEEQLSKSLAKVPYYHFIENIFAIWANTLNNLSENDEFTKLWQSSIWLSIESLPESSWHVTDSEIQRIFKSGMTSDDSFIIDVTPYQINKFILHALKSSPNEWSDLFTGSFKTLVSFLGGLDENNQQSENSRQLRRSSYPNKFLNQLKSLLWLRENKEDQNVISDEFVPSNWYMPCKLNNLNVAQFINIFHRWFSLVEGGGVDDVEQIDFTALLKSFVSELTLSELNELMSDALFCDNLFEATLVIHLLPIEKRENFALHIADRISDIERLELVLIALSENQRLRFANLHLDKISEASQLEEILSFLPHSSRTDFALSLGKCIRDSGELVAVMSQLDESNRCAYAKKNSLLIRNFDDLYDVLTELPVLDRLTFLSDHHDKIKKGREVSAVLEQLPKDKMLEFARNNAHKVKYVEQLIDIIARLSEEDRLPYVKEHTEKVAVCSCSDFICIVSYLQPQDRLGFVNTYIEKIKDGFSLSRITAVLPKPEQLPFSRFHGYMIGFDGYLSIISTLNKIDRLAFARDHADKIDGYRDLSRVLRVLPKSDRLSFLNYHQNIINDSKSLEYVLSDLPLSQRFSYACENMHVIINVNDLVNIIKQLPEHRRLALLEHQSDKVREAEGLVLLLNAFPEHDRLELAMRYSSVINDGNDVIRTIELLPANDRLVFAANNSGKVKHRDHLHDILRNLSDKHRRDFSKNQIDKIGDSNNLAIFIKVFPDSERFELAIKYSSLLSDGHDVANVIGSLATKDKLVFAQYNSDKIKDCSHLASFIIMLPGESRLEFANKFADKISECDDVCCISVFLGVDERIKYISNFINLIVNIQDLRKIIKKLNDDECIELLKMKSKLIKDYSDLSYIKDYQARNVKLFLVNEHVDKIRNSIELLNIISDFPRKDQIEVASKIYKHIEIKSKDDLLKILDLLPVDLRLELALRTQHLQYSLSCLSETISRLPRLSSSDIERLFGDKISDIDSIIYILNYLGAANKLEFANRHADKLPNTLQLYKIIDMLPVSDRLVFICKNIEKYKTVVNLVKLLELLPKPDRLILLKLLLGKLSILWEIESLSKGVRNIVTKESTRCTYEESYLRLDSALSLILILQAVEKNDIYTLIKGYLNRPECRSIDILNEELSTLLPYLPYEYKLKFVDLFLDIHIISENSVDHFISVLNQLNENDRLQFARRRLESFFAFDINDYKKIISAIPLNERLYCVRSVIFRPGIQWGKARELSLFLQDSDCLILANQLIKMVSDCAHLSSTLMVVPENDRLQLIRLHLGKVNNNNDISVVFSLLPERDCDKFLDLIRNRIKIEGFGDVVAAMGFLPFKYRLDLLNTHIDKFWCKRYDRLESHALSNAIMLLPEEIRLKYAIDNSDKIKARGTLCDFLRAIPAIERLDFAEKHSALLNGDLDEVCHVADCLKEDEKIVFINKFLHPISLSGPLFYITEKLPYSYRTKFVNFHLKAVKNDYDISHIIGYLPVAEHLELAKNNPQGIKGVYGLFEVMSELRNHEKIELATLHPRLIADIANLIKVTDTVSSHDQSELYKAPDIATIVNRFPDKGNDSLYEFIHRNKNKITNCSILVTFMKCLPQDYRLKDFAFGYIDKIKTAYDLSQVIILIRDCDRLLFVNANADKIHNQSDIGYISKYLSPEDRTKFLNEQAGKLSKTSAVTATANKDSSNQDVSITPLAPKIKTSMEIFHEYTVLSVRPSAPVVKLSKEITEERTFITPPRFKHFAHKSIERRLSNEETQFINQIIEQLTNYMNRIDGGQHKNVSKKDFEHFRLPFMRSSRGVNREINYNMAKIIHAHLKKLVNSRYTSCDDIYKLFDKFHRKGTFMRVEKHIIRSCELNGILQLGVKFTDKARRLMASRKSP